MQTMCLFCINSSKLGYSVVMATHISLKTSFDQYFDFNMATAENPALLKYNVANQNNTHKALLAISGYSFFMLFQK